MVLIDRTHINVSRVTGAALKMAGFIHSRDSNHRASRHRQVMKAWNMRIWVLPSWHLLTTRLANPAAENLGLPMPGREHPVRQQ